MAEYLQDYYPVIKALHIISIIAWMAGLLYLPRLFVYHTKASPGSELDETFKIMEYRLLKYIMNPSMIAAYILGLTLIAIVGSGVGKWLHWKILLVLILSALHGLMSAYRKDFANNENTKSELYFRILNEVPTALMVAIVLLAVVKPF